MAQNPSTSLNPGSDVKNARFYASCGAGNELIRRVQAYAKTHDISCAWRPELGKGSHGVLILGNGRTVVRNPKDELKTGTLHAMLKQLGLSRGEI